MPIDGTFIHYLVDELKPIVEKSLISKIYQPSNNEIIMQIRSNFINYQLYWNIGMDNPRIHISYKKYDNPETPYNFCMLLRKYLERGIIEKIEQIGNDRVIKLTIFSYNEMGDANTLYLYFELTGRSSNFILTSNNNIIIDAIRKLPPSETSLRSILPKGKYVLPSSDKINPFIAIDDTFYYNLEGCSKELITEFDYCNDFKSVITRQVTPVIYQGKNPSFYCFPLEHKSDSYKTYKTISELLDIYFIETKTKTNNDFIKISKYLKKEINKKVNKLKFLRDDLVDANSHLKDTDFGILLQSYLYQIKPNDTSITIQNFLNNNEPITIELDKSLNPSQNLQKYFKMAKKAEHAQEEISKQIKITKEEIEYLESVYYQLEFLSLKELNEVKNELNKYHFLPRNKINSSNRKNKIQIATYSIDGVDILIGKNNIQNEYLTNKLAKPSDYWFHVKDIPGSHVIIKSSDLSEKLIRFAANIAACFSKAHHSSSVPVDYTQVRYIKKIPGIPGYKVTYTNNKTIYIDPNIEEVNKYKPTYK